uniref:Uncharacterized protein n=1 Tax=Desertifilum tharense IPPAS B-1220 TaxID=1781255 RepID=A0ACD5GVG8_9CYAN
MEVMKLSRKRLALLALASLLIVASWWGVAAARWGLQVRSLQQDNLPLLYLAPQQAQSVPGVLIAHGFAGSKQLMLGYESCFSPRWLWGDAVGF